MKEDSGNNVICFVHAIYHPPLRWYDESPLIIPYNIISLDENELRCR